MESEGSLRPRVVERTSSTSAPPHLHPPPAYTPRYPSECDRIVGSGKVEDFQPYVSADRNIPEFTTASVVLGCALAGSMWWVAGRSKAQAHAPGSRV